MLNRNPCWNGREVVVKWISTALLANHCLRPSTSPMYFWVHLLAYITESCSHIISEQWKDKIVALTCLYFLATKYVGPCTLIGHSYCTLPVFILLPVLHIIHSIVEWLVTGSITPTSLLHCNSVKQAGGQ